MNIKNITYKIKRFFRNLYVIPKNKFIFKRYPWLQINSGVYPWSDGTYEMTWLDEMPEGWKKRFGWQLVKEIDQCLKANHITDYHIEQVKEKWGMLCWYDNGTREIHEITNKYEMLSYNTCVICGKESTHISQGWISPYCSECVTKILKERPNAKFKAIV